MISCAGLRYSYRRFEAVAGVDLDVGRGELFALLGTNGAGKTSMMDLVRGHLRPAAGAVRVLGRDPARCRRELAPLVGVVPQDSGFAPAMTVAETLRLWSRLAGHRVSGIGLDDVGLEDRAGVAVRHLSGGERRRLVLKRLRTSTLSGAGIVGGLLCPYAGLVLIQTVLLVGVTVAAGGHPPERWWPLLVAVLAGTVLSMALAVATAAVTPVPELAQLTTVPVFLGLFGGGLWLLNAGVASPPMLLVPGVPLAELVRLGWQPGSPVSSVMAVVVLSGIAIAVGYRAYRRLV